MDVGYLINVVEHQSTSGTKIQAPRPYARAVLLNFLLTGFTMRIVVKLPGLRTINNESYSRIAISYKSLPGHTATMKVLALQGKAHCTGFIGLEIELCRQGDCKSRKRSYV